MGERDKETTRKREIQGTHREKERRGGRVRQRWGGDISSMSMSRGQRTLPGVGYLLPFWVPGIELGLSGSHRSHFEPLSCLTLCLFRQNGVSHRLFIPCIFCLLFAKVIFKNHSHVVPPCQTSMCIYFQRKSFCVTMIPLLLKMNKIVDDFLLLIY